MFTVRFPNGIAVQYNTANYVTRRNEYSDLYTKKDGRWIAQIPNTCIIEVGGEVVEKQDYFDPCCSKEENEVIRKNLNTISRLKTVRDCLEGR